MHQKPRISTIVLAALAAAPLQVSAAGDGAALHGNNCTGCHDSGVYTRENRRVTTLDGLGKQVRRCELALGLSWFDEDIDAVTKYLNDSYYRFR